MAFVSPVTGVVIIINLSDGLEVAWELKVGHIHDPDELTRFAVDREPLVVPVHDEDVALVIGYDSGGLGNLTGDIAIPSVDNLLSSHYIYSVKPSI